MKKQLYILHGYMARSTDHWFPWLEKRMQNEGFQTKTMSFPNSSRPKVEDWIEYLNQNIATVDENTFFVAHSLGCITALRFLQELRKPTKIGGYILAAGFYGLIQNIKNLPAFAKFNAAAEKGLADFSDFEINFDYLSGITKNRVVVSAENDYIIPHAMSRDLAEHLNAEFYELKNGGHFLGVDGFFEFSLIYDLLMKKSKNND